MERRTDMNIIDYTDWQSIYDYYYEEAIQHGSGEEYAEKYATCQADMQVVNE